MTSIRPALLTDADFVYTAVCELEQEIFDKHKFLKHFQTNLQHPEIHYFIAESEGRPAGFMSIYIQLLLHHNGPVAEIQEIVTMPGKRSQGMGRQLLDFAMQFADEKGCELIEVACNKKRTDAHRFYERSEFVSTHFKFTRKPGTK